MSLETQDIVPTGPLYKFVSLADNQVPSWQERFKQLLDGKAYLPSPSQFNDPFDCLPTVALPTSMEAFNAKRHLLVPRFVASMPGITAEEVERALEDAFAGATIEHLSAITSSSFKRSAENTGVFCLAACVNSVLMWSHYASLHTGIALRFDWRKQLHGGIMPLFKVRYAKERHRILGFFEEPEVDDALVDGLRTKAEFWEYEQEWRFIEANAAGTTVNFLPEMIDQVILGANCRSKDAEWIYDIAEARGIEVLKAIPSETNFDIGFARVSRKSA